MADPSSSDDISNRIWRGLRNLLLGRTSEATLRDQIEEAIEEHEGDVDTADDLSLVERMMLRNLLHLGERSVNDVGVPRADMIAFEVSGSFRALVALFREAGHSRVPVYRETLDQVIGMIHVKDVYARLAEADGGIGDVSPESLLRPVLFVPESMRVLDLLARMRAGRTHMAIVVDEYGGTEGLVTIEDVVEEIVGDIEDEHDEAEVGLIQAIGDDLYEADARLDLTDLEETLGTPLGNDEIGDDVDTLGGMVFMLAGRVPGTGETIVHPSGWRFEVIDGDNRRVRRVRIHPPLAAAAVG